MGYGVTTPPSTSPQTGTLFNPTTTTSTPPGQTGITPPTVTPPVEAAPLVGPITCKPTEILQDGKCVPQPPIYCPKGIFHSLNSKKKVGLLKTWEVLTESGRVTAYYYNT